MIDLPTMLRSPSHILFFSLSLAGICGCSSGATKSSTPSASLTGNSPASTTESPAGDCAANSGCQPTPVTSGVAAPGSFQSDADGSVRTVALPDTAVVGDDISPVADILQSDLASESGYRSWKAGSLHPLTSLSSYGRSYFNAVLTTSIGQHNSEHPVGSVAVLELYAAATDATPSGWAILAKIKDSNEPSAWYSYLVQKKDGQVTAPDAHSYAEPACVGCHIGARGFIIPVKF